MKESKEKFISREGMKQEEEERINLIENIPERESIRKWFEVIENNYDALNEFALYDGIIQKRVKNVLEGEKNGREVDYLYSEYPGLEKQIKEKVSRYKKEEKVYNEEKFHTWYQDWEINSFGDKLDKLCDECAKIDAFPGTSESYMLFIQRFYRRAKEQEEKDLQRREEYYPPQVLDTYVVLPIASYVLKDIDDPKIRKELYELILFKSTFVEREEVLSESQIETFKKNWEKIVERVDEVKKKVYDRNITSDPKYKWDKKVVEWTAHIIRNRVENYIRWSILIPYAIKHGLV